MTTASFPVSLAFTLEAEGGWADNPDDPGGATNKGITLSTFRIYQPGATADDLRVIPDAIVAQIYREMFWDRMNGDTLPAGVDLTVFDFGVNSGPTRSRRLLQQAVGVTADGVLGPISMGAIAKASPSEVIARLSGLQKAHYESLDDFDEFGRGWIARNESRAAAAMRLVVK